MVTYMYGRIANILFIGLDKHIAQFIMTFVAVP